MNQSRVHGGKGACQNKTLNPLQRCHDANIHAWQATLPKGGPWSQLEEGSGLARF